MTSQYRADSRFAPSQWETLLQRNTVSHWQGANLESALQYNLKWWWATVASSHAEWAHTEPWMKVKPEVINTLLVFFICLKRQSEHAKQQVHACIELKFLFHGGLEKMCALEYYTLYKLKFKSIYKTFHTRNCFSSEKCLLQKCCPQCVNSLCSNDAIWQRRSGSTLGQIMACCLMAPSHYLTQCWLIMSEFLWHSPEGNFARNAQDIYPSYEIEIYKFKITATSPRGQWVKVYSILNHSWKKQKWRGNKHSN